MILETSKTKFNKVNATEVVLNRRKSGKRRYILCNNLRAESLGIKPDTDLSGGVSLVHLAKIFRSFYLGTFSRKFDAATRPRTLKAIFSCRERLHLNSFFP